MALVIPLRATIYGDYGGQHHACTCACWQSLETEATVVSLGPKFISVLATEYGIEVRRGLSMRGGVVTGHSDSLAVDKQFNCVTRSGQALRGQTSK